MCIENVHAPIIRFELRCSVINDIISGKYVIESMKIITVTIIRYQGRVNVHVDLIITFVYINEVVMNVLETEDVCNVRISCRLLPILFVFTGRGEYSMGVFWYGCIDVCVRVK